MALINNTHVADAFQSPRSGKFVSNVTHNLNKVMLNQQRFNPLDRENLYLIWGLQFAVKELGMFQSPRSGKFVSNDKFNVKTFQDFVATVFQSPRSGKFVSNSPKNDCSLTMSFKRTTLCWHYITNGKMFENVAKKFFKFALFCL